VNNIYRYTNLNEIELCPEFLRMRKLVDTACKSIWENEIEAKEIVAKKLLDVFGYPNKIVMHTYSGSSKLEFVNIETNEILACIETINDGTVFSTEIRYYGDWFDVN